jgi:hypothetical protein
MSTVMDILREFSKPERDEKDESVDIITFCESSWGLNIKLWPSQKWLLKMFYGVELSDKKEECLIGGRPYKGIPVYDQFLVDLRYEFSEREFLHFLYEEGRCSVKEQSNGFRELLLAIGRRGSKSAMTSIITAYELYKLLNKYSPHNHYNLLDVGKISMSLIATNVKTAGDMYSQIRQYISRCKFFEKFISKDTADVMEFISQADLEKFGPTANGTLEMLFRAAIGKNLRGPANILVVFDEFAHFADEGVSSAEDCYDASTPSTATFKDPITLRPEGKVIMLSSPLNKTGLFYKNYRQAMEGQVPYRLCVQAPSWEMNVTIASDYLRGKYRENPANFDVEFGAKFSDRFHGWIRKDTDLTNCIDPKLMPRKVGSHGKHYFAGIDIGLVNNGTAIALTHIEKGEIITDLVEEIKAGVGKHDQVDQLDFEGIADWIFSYAKKFNIHKGSFDQREGLPLEQALKKRGLKQFEMTYATQEGNSRAYQAFKLLLLDKKIKLYDFPIFDGEEHSPLIKELLELQEERISKYQIKVTKPNIPGKNDDMSDALTRSIWLAHEHLTEGRPTVVGSHLKGLDGKKALPFNSVKSYQIYKKRTNMGRGW